MGVHDKGVVEQEAAKDDKETVMRVLRPLEGSFLLMLGNETHVPGREKETPETPPTPNGGLTVPYTSDTTVDIG